MLSRPVRLALGNGSFGIVAVLLCRALSVNQNHYQKNDEGIAEKGKTGADDASLIPLGTSLDLDHSFGFTT